MSILKKLFGDPNARAIAQHQRVVDRISVLEKGLQEKTDAQLYALTATYRARLAAGETLEDLVPEAFATVREMSRRKLGQRQYDVQLLGGLVLHGGNIAEMRTGEGKTLTATTAVYTNALTGKGVHVVTVNDYLARRDAVWMGQIYHALGMRVGVIQHEHSYLYDPSVTGAAVEETDPKKKVEGEETAPDTREIFHVEMASLRACSRAEAYAADITYGTNNEYGFDYLRDNMVQDKRERVQGALHYAIVDEVDSILIDEARTPLIISAPAEESTDLYYRFAELVTRLEESDITVDEKLRAAFFTADGQEHVAKLLGKDPWATSDLTTVHHLEQALRARTLYHLDQEYVVRDGEVIIVDEFTGRMMQGRRYSEGLHQAIEAKEGVKIQRESRTLATVTFQNYFRLYEKLAGMTGTAATEAEEFSKIYQLDVVTIPTNKITQRKDGTDLIYKSAKGKYAAVVEEIKARHATGQPMLVGTVSIEKNELLSSLLTKAGVPHAVLNAKNHEKEAEIIAQAGRIGGVTIATNMAGRGVDILLGGNPATAEEAAAVRAAGGVHVIGTERHESRRIDNQLRGRSGRQGDPGSSQFFLSLEDDLMRIFSSDRVKRVMEAMNVPEDMPIESAMVSKTIAGAQKKVEGHNFDIRKHLLEYDDVLNKHREAIYRRRREIVDTEILPSSVSPFRASILASVEEEVERLVHLHTSTERGATWNVKEIYDTANAMFPIPAEARGKIVPLDHQADPSKLADITVRTQLIEQLMEHARAAYDAMEARVNNPEIAQAIERNVLLRTIDGLWIEHLDAMEHLRTGIGLRGYGQRDPLVEYKRESYRMYQELVALIGKQVAHTIFKVHIAVEQPPAIPTQHVHLSAPAKEGDAGVKLEEAGKAAEKIGRNDLCYCGSGKKYKKCGLIDSAEHQANIAKLKN